MIMVVVVEVFGIVMIFVLLFGVFVSKVVKVELLFSDMIMFIVL